MVSRKLFTALSLLLLIGACTPKTTEPATTTTEKPTPTPPPEPEENLSPCPKFSDLSPGLKDETENNYVIYRDFLRTENWDGAFKLWKKVYKNAPAADGKRNTVFSDGIRFYERFISQTQDEDLKASYVDTIFMLYDEIDKCYPEGGYVAGRKAFDYFYKYRDMATKEEMYELFKKSFDMDGLDAQYFILNPFTSLLVEMYYDDKIDMAEAQKYQQLVRDRLAKGREECEGIACEHWAIINEYVPVRLETFESERGFYDCEYYMEKYYPEFEQYQDSCDVVRTVFSRLSWGECPKADKRFKELIRVGNANCRETGVLELAYEALREARYQDAIDLFQKAVEEEEDTDKKAEYTLIIAKVYNAHLKNFSTARKYALQAADLRPNWGEPYILIGRLYASSGPLCGPGRGWDSQIVTWPAIDMWNKAKRVDPSVASEANKWIRTYSQYMPNKEDVFIRNLNAGDSYYVGCWIQVSTTIRTSD